jgi:PKD repeat protein
MKATLSLRGDRPRARESSIAPPSSVLGAVRSFRYFLISVTLLSMGATAGAADFYAAPGGNASASGTLASPWDLQTALNQTVARPGDTIWLRGGVYHGTYTSHLNGTASSPIVVRQYLGERATIDGGNSGWTSILMVSGSYTWYWGFEVMSSDPNRISSQTGSNPTDIGRGNIATEQTSRTGAGLKFINLIIHDIQDAGLWKEAVGSEFYGSLIYYDGWNAPDRGHGHGLYLQNLTGTMSIRDNVIFENFQNGIQCYGSESAYLNNFDIEGNTIFNNGSIVSSPANNIIIGGGVVAQNPAVKDNNLYYTAWGNGINVNMGYYPYGIGASNPVMTGNYAGNGEFDLNSADTNTTLSGNAIYSSLVNWTPSQFPSNTFYASKPSAAKIVVRPNAYEPGRANITVYNWNLAATVSVDVSAVLAAGQAYEVRNAQNWFGAPVAAGTYDGTPLNLPMTGLGVATPVGWAAPPASGPEFNVFVLLPKSAASGSPSAQFTSNPNPATAASAVQFNDATTNSPTSWSWDFGDPSSTSDTSNLENPAHTFAASGTYTVRLTASNAAGSSSTTHSITVNPNATPPSPSFSFSPAAPAPGQSVQFTDTSNGSPTAWSWTFGDGGTSAVRSPTHVYAAAGTFTVTLTASNAAGSASLSKSVTVTAPSGALPDPHFSITPNPAKTAQTVQFTDTTLNSPTSWSWNFGDPASASNTSTLRNPAHVYASAGVFTIRLTAANAAGSSSTTNTVTVTAPTILPAASFGAAYKGTLLTEQFTDTSTGSPTSWAWSFGDTASGAANASTAKNPSHTFSKVGAYTVKLTVRNAAGSSSASHSLNVYMYRLVVSSTAAPQPIVTSRN